MLIEADLGLDTAERIIATLGKGRYEKGIEADDVRAVLKAEVERVLAPVAQPLSIDAGHKPHVILVVGVNGTGKTTTIGKLAAQLAARGQDGHARRRRHLPRRRHRSAEDLGRAHGLRPSSPAPSNSDAAGLVYDALGAGARRAAPTCCSSTPRGGCRTRKG